jgi:ring-1,2-phenylacetyl-CoA epoxidase subunit PaaE
MHMSTKTHVAFAAGGGIAPLLQDLRTILTHDHDARVLLFYGADTVSGVESLEALQALKNRHLEHLSLYFFFTGDPQDVDLFNGALDADKVRQLAGTFFDPAGVHEFLLAGPESCMAPIAEALVRLGVQEPRIRLRNEAAPVHAGKESALTPGPSPASGRGEEETEVTVLMDGRRRSFVMNRVTGESVLDAAEHNGLDLPFSCRAGVCSTCRTKVVKGSVEMEQNYALEPWELEQGYVLACQSHPTTSELELDYDDK